MARVLGLLMGIVLILAGCGGAGSSTPKRGRLVAELSSSLRSASPVYSPGMLGCVTGRARTLPLAQLRAMTAPPPPTPAVRRLVARQLSACIADGDGAEAIRTEIMGGISASLPSSLARLTGSCLAVKVGAVPSATLSRLVLLAGENRPAFEAQARAVGVLISRPCLVLPSVLTRMRLQLVSGLRARLKATRLAAAFRACVVTQADHTGLGAMRTLALDPSRARAWGATAMVGWTRTCRRSLHLAAG